MRIEINGLTARYAASKQPLYGKLDAWFPDRRITGLFGPNAVGKSTLVRLLGHLEEGIISNSAEAIVQSPDNAYIAYVPQRYAQSLLPWMSIDDNISLPLTVLSDRGTAEIASHCLVLKEAFNIRHTTRYTSGLSGGQQQIVVLLRAIIRHPDLLLLDEPFSALDIYSGSQFRDAYFRYLNDNGITTIFVTHDLHECIRFSDRIMFLQKATDGSAFIQAVEDFPENHKVFVRNDGYLSAMAERLGTFPACVDKTHAC